jgi:hypothetical protein
VVRTVTLFRVGSGYVYRVDSGWKAQTDGLFDFRFRYVKTCPATSRTAATRASSPTIRSTSRWSRPTSSIRER